MVLLSRVRNSFRCSKLAPARHITDNLGIRDEDRNYIDDFNSPEPKEEFMEPAPQFKCTKEPEWELHEVR